MLVVSLISSCAVCHFEEWSDEEPGEGRRFAFRRVSWPQPPQILRSAHNEIGQVYVD